VSGPRCHERGKVAFSNFAQATKEANKLTWKNKELGIVPSRVEVYVCPDCDMFHIGRGPKGNDRDAAIRS
jgi:hypothetical protein